MHGFPKSARTMESEAVIQAFSHMMYALCAAAYCDDDGGYIARCSLQQIARLGMRADVLKALADTSGTFADDLRLQKAAFRRSWPEELRQ